jgi:Tol biopolymer transport system component
MKKNNSVFWGLIILLVFCVCHSTVWADDGNFEDYIAGWNQKGDKILFFRFLSVEDASAQKNEGIFYLDTTTKKTNRIDCVPIKSVESLNWYGNDLVYCETGDCQYRIYKISTDGKRKELLADLGNLSVAGALVVGIGRISASPQKAFIAFSLKRKFYSSDNLFRLDKGKKQDDEVGFMKNGADIFVYNTISKTIKRITKSVDDCTDPKWSADGRFLVFTSSAYPNTKPAASTPALIKPIQSILVYGHHLLPGR